MKTTAGLNFVNIKKNSKEEDFKDYSFMVQDIAGVLVGLDLVAVIVEIYRYTGTQEEKADIIKRICTSFSDNEKRNLLFVQGLTQVQRNLQKVNIMTLVTGRVAYVMEKSLYHLMK